MKETRVPTPARKDPLEKEIATHSSILAWRIPWTEEPGGLQSMGSQRVRHNSTHHAFTVIYRKYSIVGMILFILSLYCCLVTESCLTLCNPMDCRLPGSSVHGISQAGILEWFGISFSRGSSQPRDSTHVLHCRQILYHWATREAHLYNIVHT